MIKNETSLRIIQRESEQKRLKNFLEDKQGGAILVAGDRGSGKTTLIENVLEQNYHKFQPRRGRWLTFHRQIVLRIPLILELDSQSDQGARDKLLLKYRSLLLRTIARSMESDLLSRRFGWLDLPVRWFRSLGYVQAVHRLSPYINSISLDKMSRLQGSFSKLVMASHTMQMSQKVDISDAVIEMRIRDIFSTYTRDNTIVIVIDELDKLEDLQPQIKVEDLAMLLKNLFNETGVHVIFISSEKTIGRIHSRIKSAPFSIEHTLFRDMILLNQFTPEQLEFVLEKTVDNFSVIDKRKAIAGMSMITKLMPFEVMRFKQKYGIGPKTLLTSIENEVGELGYLYEVTMHVFINDTYKKYSEGRDYYHNRILYKALVEAGTILFNTSIDYLNWENMETLFYTRDLFAHSPTEHEAKRNEDFSGIERPDIIQQLDMVNKDERRNILSAVKFMLTTLERAGYTDFKLDDIGPLRYGIFIGDAFNVENVKYDIGDYLKPTELELERIELINRFNDLFVATNQDSLFSGMLRIPVEERGAGQSVKAFNLANYERTLRAFWVDLSDRLVEVESKIFGGLAAMFETHYNQTYFPKTRITLGIEQQIANKLITLSLKEKSVAIYLAYDKIEPIVGQHEKVFIFYVGKKPLKNNRNNRIKSIDCGPNWIRIDDAMKTVMDDLYNRKFA